ncbi:electron transfer flavoprotein subunit beta/FixA family protein [Candidatus Izimaplasma bacterium]|nr:electron transfer flavoprotein subunit beta/FixA family protein [Candidatus Izimaplasma bacterium]
MKIITCIKQVPASSNVEVDPNTGVLIRDGNNVKMNPYDLYALESAFHIKSINKKTMVHAVTMGPPSAKSVLEEALYMGADEATLISDKRFAGADVLATSYTLSQLIEHINDYEIIICGKQTTDGDTAQVGPEIAEFLHIPHVPYVKEIIEIKERSVILQSGYDDYDEVVEVMYPCLITIEKGYNVPRLPSYKRKMILKNYKIKTKTLKDLKDKNPENYGLNGSPTQVDEIFPPEKLTDSIKVEGTTEELAQKMISILQESRFI